MKIRTTYVYPPIPDRRHDWQAVDDDTYDGPGSPIGSGATEAEAIADLMEQIEEEIEDDQDECTCPTRQCWDTGEPLRSGTDSWCPIHGVDPDQAYDEMRDRAMEDR